MNHSTPRQVAVVALLCLTVILPLASAAPHATYRSAPEQYNLTNSPHSPLSQINYDSDEALPTGSFTWVEVLWLWSGDPDDGTGLTQPSNFDGITNENYDDWQLGLWGSAQSTDLVHRAPPDVADRWNRETWDEFQNGDVGPGGTTNLNGNADTSLGPDDSGTVDGDNGDIQHAQTNIFAVSPSTVDYDGDEDRQIAPSGTVYIISDFATNLPVESSEVDGEPSEVELSDLEISAEDIEVEDLEDGFSYTETLTFVNDRNINSQTIETGDGTVITEDTTGATNIDGRPQAHDAIDYNLENSDVDPSTVDELVVETEMYTEYEEVTYGVEVTAEDDEITSVNVVTEGDVLHEETVTVTDSVDVEVVDVEDDDFEVAALDDETSDDANVEMAVFADDDVNFAGYRVPDESLEEEALRTIPRVGDLTANTLVPRREVYTNYGFLTARDTSWDTLTQYEDVGDDEVDFETSDVISDARPLSVHAVRGQRPEGASVGVDAGQAPEVQSVYTEEDEWTGTVPEDFDVDTNGSYSDQRVTGLTTTHYEIEDAEDTALVIYSTVDDETATITSDDEQFEERHRYESNLTMEIVEVGDSSTTVEIELFREGSADNPTTGDGRQYINLNPDTDPTDDGSFNGRYEPVGDAELQTGQIVIQHETTNDVVRTLQPSDGQATITIDRLGRFTATYEPAPWTSADPAYTRDTAEVSTGFDRHIEYATWVFNMTLLFAPVIYILYRVRKFNEEIGVFQ